MAKPHSMHNGPCGVVIHGFRASLRRNGPTFCKRLYFWSCIAFCIARPLPLWMSSTMIKLVGRRRHLMYARSLETSCCMCDPSTNTTSHVSVRRHASCRVSDDLPVYNSIRLPKDSFSSVIAGMLYEKDIVSNTVALDCLFASNTSALECPALNPISQYWVGLLTMLSNASACIGRMCPRWYLYFLSRL